MKIIELLFAAFCGMTPFEQEFLRKKKREPHQSNQKKSEQIIRAFSADSDEDWFLS
jgi:hypothetical protein